MVDQAVVSSTLNLEIKAFEGALQYWIAVCNNLGCDSHS